MPPNAPSLPSAVTAYTTPRVATLKPVPRTAAPAALAAGLVAVVVLVVAGGDPLLVPLGFVVGVAVVLLTYPVGAVPRIVGVVVLGGAALGVLGSLGGGAVVGAVLVGALAGLVVLLRVLADRARRRRLATATGAPAVDVDPRGGVDVGVLASWRDAEHEYDAVDPTAEVVLDAVRRLDAEHHCYVSVFRGTGRLDVIGEAGGPLVVQQRDHRTAPDWDHWVATLPSARAGARTGELVEVGYRAHVIDGGHVVGMAQVEAAVRAWLATGVRDTGLHWVKQEQLDRTLSPRPVRETD